MIRTVISDLGRVVLWFDNNVFLRKRAERAGRRFEEAYNLNWSCPLTPRENRLTVRIEAGEKNFEASEH